MEDLTFLFSSYSFVYSSYLDIRHKRSKLTTSSYVMSSVAPVGGGGGIAPGDTFQGPTPEWNKKKLWLNL